MKKINFKKLARYSGLLMLLFAFSLSVTSCVVKTPHHHEKRKLPPGQEKKLRGDRSAKRYAPGQQKKKHHKKPGKGHKMKTNKQNRGR